MGVKKDATPAAGDCTVLKTPSIWTLFYALNAADCASVYTRSSVAKTQTLAKLAEKKCIESAAVEVSALLSLDLLSDSVRTSREKD
jgi:hypothetical protein